MTMSRAEAIELRTKQLNGGYVDADVLQVAVLVIARTVHDPDVRPKKRAARKPKTAATPGEGQDLAWAAQKEVANRALLAKLGAAPAGSLSPLDWVQGRIEPVGHGLVAMRVGPQEWMHTGVSIDEHGNRVELRDGRIVGST